LIRYDRTICRDLNAGGRREWLETNGIGGYASSTLCGLNTRRYHGLLVAATQPPAGRMVLLSKLEETLVIDGRRYELSCNRYPGVVYPEGHQYLAEFRLDPWPVWVYEIEGVALNKSVRMVYGENTTIVRYELRGGSGSLELRPLIAFRDFHATTHENGAINPSFEIEAGRVALSPYSGCPDLYLAHGTGEVRAEGYWYRNFEYPVEQERGLDFHEDLFNPLTIRFDLMRERSATLIASTEPHPGDTARAVPDDPLLRAADQFLVRRGEGCSVIAGYHWFCDWGRDTMVSMPGLTLATGRYEEARRILLEFASAVDRGMLPNRFPDAGGTLEYNTVDAALWFFEAARALVERTGDLDFVRGKLLPVLADIVAWHERGTRYGIHVDSDSLLAAGEPGVQLTWMDAKVGDWVVTPRHGKPVEIQALWYNALRIMETWTGKTHYRDLADRVRESFRRLFWNQAAGCLYDVVGPEDGAIRPNQIFAVGLPHRMLEPAQERSVVETVERDLLTPYGLRTLAPSDPKYRGRYGGDQWHRDSAYHQGTVWPWLLGPYAVAYRYVYGRSPDVFGELRRYMMDEGVGQVPEVFDGDAPHRAGGCIAQAWSVAALVAQAFRPEGRATF
jgi:glycogen debranching enzyme